MQLMKVTDDIVFYHTFTNSITPTLYQTGIEVADVQEDSFGPYLTTDVADIYAFEDSTRSFTLVDYTDISVSYNKGARVDSLDSNIDDLNWWAISYP